MKILIAAVLLLVSALAADAQDAARPNPIIASGKWTATWTQRIDDPAATQPSLQLGNLEVALLPAPKAKPKDPPAFNVALGDPSRRSKTLIYPGKPYQFALAAADGKMQLFINGFPDGDPQPLPATATAAGTRMSSASVQESEVMMGTLPAEMILDRFRQQLRPRPIVTVAHRGINRFAPENTRISYVQAVAAGAPILEFDTALTSDGHIIGMHDKTVDRTTEGTGKVAEMTLEQIRKLDAGVWKDPKYKGEPVPTLEEVADVAHKGNAILMLDLKAEGQGAAIAKWLESSKYPHEQLILAPWEDAEAIALRKHVPSTIPMIRLTSKVPTETVNDAYFAKAKSIGLSGFSVNWQYLTDAFVKGAQANGMKVYTWTLNDPSDLAGAALLGVDGVITDDSARTIKLLADLTKK
jgi:glycerophosphoryl diester phosphodiesterase